MNASANTRPMEAARVAMLWLMERVISSRPSSGTPVSRILCTPLAASTSAFVYASSPSAATGIPSALHRRSRNSGSTLAFLATSSAVKRGWPPRTVSTGSRARRSCSTASRR
jgi:hypothetical protein